MCKHGSSCVHSAPPPLPGRHFSLSFPLCVTCARPRRGSVDAPSVVNSSRHRLDQQDAKTAHTWFYPAAGKPFDGIAIMRSSKDKLHQSGKIPQTVYTLRGDTPFHRRKKEDYLCSVNVHRIFSFMAMSKRVAFVKRCCAINHIFLCFKLHLHKVDGISVKMVTFLQQTPSSASTSRLF